MAQEFDSHRLRNVQFVPLTAFDQENRLNLSAMRELLGRLHAAGGRVFITCAGSAEFHSLTSQEILDCIRLAREAVGEESVVMVPLGYDLPSAREMLKQAVDAGADTGLVMPLGFPYLSNEGARDYYLRLLDAAPCPLLIYKKSEIPSDDLLLELAGHENLVGVKYAVNDIDAFHRIVQDDGGRIEWICGSAERFAPFFMLAGATGYTSGAGNVCPHLTLSMFRACAKGDWERGLALQRHIRPIEDYRARAASSYNISFLKQAIRATGLDFGPPRPPQRQITAEEAVEIEAILSPILEAEKNEAQANQPATATG